MAKPKMLPQTPTNVLVSLWMSDGFHELSLKHQTQIILALQGEGIKAQLDRSHKKCAMIFGMVAAKPAKKKEGLRRQ